MNIETDGGGGTLKTEIKFKKMKTYGNISVVTHEERLTLLKGCGAD